MHKALVLKELRESAGLVALAALGLVYALSELTATRLLPWQSSQLYWYPFVGDELGFYFTLVGGGLAIALALKQTAWELGQGTYVFLLHRPVSRSRVFAHKLAVGILLVMLLSGLLVLAYAWWASRPGQFPAPFFWSMTVPAWQMWLALPVVYFGAFLAGIRPGRWFGSRLVPLVPAVSVAMLAANVPWPWLTVLISLAASVLLVMSILYYVGHRDY
jgi:hypothetical protein